MVKLKQVENLLATLAGLKLPEDYDVTCNGTDATYTVPHTWNNIGHFAVVVDVTTGKQLTNLAYFNGQLQDTFTFTGGVPVSGYKVRVTTFGVSLISTPSLSSDWASNDFITNDYAS